MHYHHTQFGAVIVCGMLVPGLAVLFIPVYLGSLAYIMPVALAVLLAGLALFHSLSVDVADGAVVCSFGIGLLRRRINLSDVQEVRPVNNPWWAGWGIRWIPGQYWLWNVSGLQGVELLFRDGTRFRIGSDEPEALANAIRTNLPRRDFTHENGRST